MQLAPVRMSSSDFPKVTHAKTEKSPVVSGVKASSGAPKSNKKKKAKSVPAVQTEPSSVMSPAAADDKEHNVPSTPQLGPKVLPLGTPNRMLFYQIKYALISFG
jgi:hypothetical protein